MTILVLRPTRWWGFGADNSGGAPNGTAINAPNSLHAICDDNWGTYHQGNTIQGNGLSAYPQPGCRWGQVRGDGKLNPTFPALGQLRQLRVGARLNVWSGGSTIQSWSQGLYPGRVETMDINAIRAGVGTFYTAWSSTQSNGTAWTAASMDTFGALSYPSSYNIGANFWVDYAENWIEADVNLPPSLEFTGPTGVIASLTPNIVFTYSDPEGDGKERHTVKVFRRPAAGWGGLDPETNTADLHYTSGNVASSATSQAMGTALTRGVTYRVYGKAADVGSGSRYGHWTPGPDFKVDASGWGGISR